MEPAVGKIPWGWSWHPTPVFFPGEFHGQRSLAGYSPWGHRESDRMDGAQRHSSKGTEKAYDFWACLHLEIGTEGESEKENEKETKDNRQTR